MSLSGACLRGRALLCSLFSLPSHPFHSMASDGTVAILISLVMFIIPSKIPGLIQDPSKHLPWGWGGSPAACLQVYSLQPHLAGASKAPLGDLPKTQGVRDRVGILQRWETEGSLLPALSSNRNPLRKEGRGGLFTFGDHPCLLGE